MPNLSHNDIVQQYAEAVVFYKGKPHKVKHIGMNEITLLDIRSQRKKFVEFNLKDFRAPQTRLGMVNLDGSVVYVRRTIKKQFSVGLTATNTEFISLDAPSSIPRMEAKSKVKMMECPEFGDMLLGHYPSMKEAYLQAKEFVGTVAFDKQFAIDWRGSVWHRLISIGHYSDEKENILFAKEYKHYSILLKEHHEEVVRDFR